MIDITRVKKTRCGHPVRIYATDGGAIKETIHGAVLTPGRGWVQFSWYNTGQAYLTDPKHDYDLIEESETVEIDVWLNVYESDAFAYATRKVADAAANPRLRLACLHIKQSVKKGEGL